MKFTLTFYKVDALLCADSLSVLAQKLILATVVEKAIKTKSGNKNEKQERQEYEVNKRERKRQIIPFLPEHCGSQLLLLSDHVFAFVLLLCNVPLKLEITESRY